MPTTPIPFAPGEYMGRTGTWRSPQGITVPIACNNARRAYGRIELLITPVHGEGEAWVQASYVTLDKISLQPKSAFDPQGATSPTADVIAALFKTTPARVRLQFGKHAKQLRQMAVRAGTEKYRGYTADDLNRLADAAERKANEQP